MSKKQITLEELPLKVQQKIQEYCIHEKQCGEYLYPFTQSGVLQFLWSSTPEGKEYWNRINERLTGHKI